jgi:hypothetical protein
VGRTERKALIEQIEDIRKSKVIAYILGDRRPTPDDRGRRPPADA